MKTIYILLTRSGTLLSKLVYAATGASYTHASMAFDEELNCLYSSTRKNGYTMFPAGPSKEYLNKGVFRLRGDAPCALYALTLDLELILPFPFVCSAALMIPLPLAAPWLRRLYAVFQQDKAPALLMMLLVYLQLVSFSLMTLPFSTIPFALAAGCVVLTLCADMALLPLLQRLFLHAQEEEQLSRMYMAYGMRLRSRMKTAPFSPGTVVSVPSVPCTSK